MYRSTSALIAAIALGATPAMAADWSGAYFGGELGYGNFDDSVVSEDEFVAGVIAGYDHDFGTWVLGGGIDFDWADVSGVDVQTFRLKARAGYKIGEGLLYGTAGYTNIDIEGAGDDDGYVIGAGYEHLISEKFSVGGEVLYHDYDNFNSTGFDVESTTVQVRGAFRF